MNKKTFTITGIIILAIIAGSFWYVQKNTKQETVNREESNDIVIPVKTGIQEENVIASDNEVYLPERQAILGSEENIENSEIEYEVKDVIDVSNEKMYKNDSLGFEIIHPEEVFNTKFEVVEENEIVRFYDIGCEFDEVAGPASDCVNINIHKKLIENFSKTEKKIYQFDFTNHFEINGKKAIFEWQEDSTQLRGGNVIVKDEDAYYMIMVGGVYFDFTSEFIEKYKLFVSTFKIFE